MKALPQQDRPTSDAARHSACMFALRLSSRCAYFSSVSFRVTRAEAELSATSPSVRSASILSAFNCSTPTADCFGTFHSPNGLATSRTFSLVCCIRCLSFYRFISTSAHVMRGFSAFRRSLSPVIQHSRFALSRDSGSICEPTSPNHALQRTATLAFSYRRAAVSSTGSVTACAPTMKPGTCRAFASRRRAHTRALGPRSLSLGSLGVATSINR